MIEMRAIFAIFMLDAAASSKISSTPNLLLCFNVGFHEQHRTVSRKQKIIKFLITASTHKSQESVTVYVLNMLKKPCQFHPRIRIAVADTKSRIAKRNGTKSDIFLGQMIPTAKKLF